MLFLLWFSVLLVTGQAGFFSVVFLSLLLHELGHLFALKAYGVNGIRCVVYPFGARIYWEHQMTLRPAQQFWVYAGGPIATCVFTVLLFLLPLPIPTMVVDMQFVILALNLYPLFPLDGEGMIRALFAPKFPRLVKAINILAYTGMIVILMISTKVAWWWLTIICIVLIIENYKRYNY